MYSNNSNNPGATVPINDPNYLAMLQIAQLNQTEAGNKQVLPLDLNNPTILAALNVNNMAILTQMNKPNENTYRNYSITRLNEIKECMLPTQITSTLIKLICILIPFICIQIGLSFFSIITSGGNIIGGIYLSPFVFALFPYLASYPGFLAKYVVFENPDNPAMYVENSENNLRVKLLTRRLYLGYVICLCCFVSIIVESIKLAEMSDLVACSTIDGFGDACNNPSVSSDVECFGDSKYFPAAAMCNFGYTPTFGVGTTSLGETCKCIAKNSNSCSSYKGVIDCGFIFDVYPVTEPILITTECVLLLLVGYINYLLYYCIHDPVYFIYSNEKPNSISVINH